MLFTGRQFASLAWFSDELRLFNFMVKHTGWPRALIRFLCTQAYWTPLLTSSFGVNLHSGWVKTEVKKNDDFWSIQHRYRSLSRCRRQKLKIYVLSTFAEIKSELPHCAPGCGSLSQVAGFSAFLYSRHTQQICCQNTQSFTLNPSPGVPFSFSSFSQRLLIFNFSGSNFAPLPSTFWKCPYACSRTVVISCPCVNDQGIVYLRMGKCENLIENFSFGESGFICEAPTALVWEWKYSWCM